MAESTEPASSQPQAEDVHWALYLRDDLRDIRGEIRAFHTRIDGTNSRLDSNFRWMMTTMIAMTGVITAVIKL